MHFSLGLALLASFTPAAPVPKQLKKQDDAALIVGRWKPAPGQEYWLDFTADGTMRIWSGEDDKGAAAYKWMLDSTVSPKRMTWVGVSNSQTWEGVYELYKESLKISYVRAGKRVPAEVGPAPDGFFCDQVRESAR